MDFGLSEEQERLRDAARELLARECPMERVRKIAGEAPGHDAALWRTFAEAGWLGILVPEAAGGAGHSAARGGHHRSCLGAMKL